MSNQQQHSVAIIGASADPSKFGNKAVRAYLRQGWTVYPVTPRPEPIEGLATFPSVSAIPGRVDRAALYLPPGVGIKVLAEVKAKNIGELFVNPGADSPELLAEAERIGLNPIMACAIVEIGERP